MENPIYKFMKENGLTQKDEATFVSEYSNPQKSAEIHRFMTDNGLTSKNYEEFYNEYFNPSKKKVSTGSSEPAGQPGKPSAPSFGQKVTEKIANSASQTQIPLKTEFQQKQEKQADEKKVKAPTSKYFEVDIEEKPDEIKAPKIADPIVVAKNSQKSKAIFNSVVGDKDVYKMPTRGESNQYASDITSSYLDYLELIGSDKIDTYKEKYKELKSKSKDERSSEDEEFLRQVESEAVGAFYDAKEQELFQLSNEIDNLEKIAVTEEDKQALNDLYGQYEKKRNSLIGTSSVYAQNKFQYGKIAGREMQDEEEKMRRFQELQAGDGKTVEFFKGIGSAVSNGVLSLYQVPKVFGDLIGDTDYDWADEMYDAVSGAKADIDREFGAPLPKGKTMSNLPFTARLAVVGGNAIGSAALFAAGGTLGGATSLGQSAATFGTAFLTSEADYYQEALDAGMSPQDAALTGTYLAAQTALVESIIPDIKYFQPGAFRKSVMQGVMSGIGKGLPVKEAAKLALKNTLKAIPESGIAYAKTGIKESGEELLGQVGEDLGKEMINAVGKREYFNDTFNGEAYTDAILGGFIAGGGMSVFSRPTAKSPVQEEVMREIVEKRPHEKLKGTASDSIAKEDMSSLDDATETFEAMSSHSGWKDMSREEQNHAFALAQQAEVMKKEQERMKKLRIPDEQKDAQIKQLEDEVNTMFAEQLEKQKQKKNDQENIQGVPSQVGKGQKPITTQPVEVTSAEAPQAGGVLQAQEEVVAPQVTEEPAPKPTRKTRLAKMFGEEGEGETTVKISETAPSVRRAGAVEASEDSNEDAGTKSALKGVGLDETTLEDWKKKNKAPSKKGRIEEMTQAVRDLMSGKIKFKEYYEKAKQLMPSKPMEKVPTPASFEEVVGSIDKNKLKIGIINLNKFVKKGMKVGLRIDIPAFNNFGKSIVTVHDKTGSGQPVIGYGSTGSISNVKFKTSVSTAAKIGAGEQKSAFAMAEGQWMDESPESIQKRAEEALNSPEWVQVSMNPARNSFFFDKADGNPVIAADEVLQVGNLVLAKNPQKIDLNTKEGMAQFEQQFSAKTKEGVTYQYRTSKSSSGKRLAKMFETSDGEEAVPLIEQALSESGIKVEVKDDADYNNDDRIKRSQGSGSEGMFVADDGTIILNRDKIKGEWGKTIVFHEGIHPVVNIIRNTDPKRYRAIVDGLKAEATRNNAVAKAAADIAASEEYQRRGPESIEDETVVETMARVATGDIDINTFKPSFREKFIEFMNDIAKVFGLRPILTNSPRVEVKRLAEQINKMLNEGGKISDVVGKKNVGKFQNTISDGQYSIDARIADKGVEVPRSEKLPLKIVASKEESVMRRINELLDKYPNALTDKEQWKELMSRVFPITVDGEVFIPAFPEGLSRMAGSVQETLKEINKVSDEQRKLASEGLKGTKEIGELYKQGKMDEVDTGLYFLWNIMSIGISPYPQESGFLQAVNGGVDKYIKLAAAGKFNENTLKEYLNWVDGVLPKGTPGAGSKSNLNSFGKSFLSKAAQEIESGEFEGKTKLQALHEILSDRKTPTNELRRKWQANMSAMQFNNKIFDFILLTTGRSDLFVTDRVRVDHFWDGNNFKKKRGLKESTSLYDGSDLTYGAATGAGFSKILSDVPGLVFNELANRTMTPIVEKAYKQIGVKDYPEVGRFHWETWVAASSQEVSHGSIDAIVQRKEKGEIQDAGIRQGKYGAWDFNFAYKKRAGKDFVYEFVDNDGNIYVFDKINDIQDEIEKQKKKTYETNNRFLLPDAKGNISRPTKGLSTAWYDTELVDAEKYFEFLRSKAKEIIPAPDVVEDQGVVIEKPKSEKISKETKPTGQPSQGIPRTPKEFAGNVGETIDRIKAATSEDGATLNLDGTTYEDGGLVVPAGSLNVAQDEVTAEGLFEFLKDNEENISSDIFKIGLYKFPDRPEVSYDLNIVIPREYRDVALKFGELSGQESLFDLDTFENIKTGSDGKNPRKFTAQELAEIAKDLSEGRLPKIVSKEEIDRKWGEKKMIALTKRDELGTKADREIAAYASKFLNKFGPYTKANVVQIMNMSAEEKIKLINDTFEARVKKMNPAFREPGNDFYDQSVKRRDEVLALVTKPTGQPSMMKRTPAQIRQAVEDGVDAVEAAIAEGMDPQQAVDENISNQEWYGDLNAAQKEQLNEILQDEFGATASEPKLQNNAQRVADLWERGGKEAKAEIKNILETDPELSYIYNNFPKITKQLQEQGLLTKTENCP
jgi:hypothetical protein